jgi:hypothetical protein
MKAAKRRYPMLLIHTTQPLAATNFSFEGSGNGEDCIQQIADAERELAAFAMAVEASLGSETARLAADCWLELAEHTKLTG